MEVLISLCFVALSTVLAIWLVKLIVVSCGGSSKAKKELVLPPGPWNAPIIGSLHHVVGGLPHRTLAELSSRHGPVMFLMFGEVATVVVSSAEAAELVMKKNDLKFANRPRTPTLDIVSSGGKGIGFAPYGEHWRQMRKVGVAALLSAKQVKRLEGIRAQEVGNLLRSLSASARGGAINLSEKFSSLSNNISSRAVFSGRCARQDEFLRAVDEVLVLLAGFNLVDLFPSSRLARWFTNGERDMRRSSGRIQGIISDMVEERKAARAAGDRTSADSEDLLEVLLRLQEEDSLPFPLTTEIIGVVILVSKYSLPIL
jgi:cytochrome P450